jgi:outer membrane lipoprotein LolB
MVAVLHRARRLALLAAVLALTACALPPRAPQDPAQPNWNGRLALQVEGVQSQSFSASFELRGSAERGELALYTPLGATAAQLQWQPGAAILKANGEERRYASVEALSADATGTPLPLAALFDWLAGRAAEVPGWQADLSRVADGRLTARRISPTPPAELRIVFAP